MKKTLASAILLFAMITSLNATEVVAPIKDSNCTTVKCKTEKPKDSNCTKTKCKTEKKSDCAVPCKVKDCTKCDKDALNKVMPTLSGSADENATMKKPSCCKGEKKEESKKEESKKEESKKEEETNESKPMKCAAGKCGGGKCGGGK